MSENEKKNNVLTEYNTKMLIPISKSNKYLNTSASNIYSEFNSS